jgi:glucose/arabinose dehydrogenase
VITKSLIIAVAVIACCSISRLDAQVPADSIGNYYTVENIPMPAGLLAETGGIDFMPDGRLLACFHRGEVMTYQPKTKEWKVFAEGLHDPLGIMAVSNTEILVMQRPELTRIRDTDGNGQADLYETVTDDFGLSGNYHEYNFGPVKDKEGNLYISLNLASGFGGSFDEVRGTFDSLGRPGRMYSCVPYRGWVMKLDNNGKLIPWALGFRSPNGLGFDAQGNLFVPDNQGDWIGTSPLYHVQQGKFYGHPSSLVWKDGYDTINPLKIPVPELDKMRTKAAVLFPHGSMANSPTQPLLDNTGGKFGPFAGQMLIGEMNQARLIRLMMETVDGQIQGACVPFYDNCGLRKGNNRIAFAPDGSLWIGQNDHDAWTGDEGIQRISWNGKTPMDVYEMHLTPKGFDLVFTQPVDVESASKTESYQFRRYYYEYHQAYGSEQFDVQPVAVKKVKISKDRKKVSLQLAELKPGYVYELQVKGVQSQEKKPVINTLICYTLNRLKK